MVWFEEALALLGSSSAFGAGAAGLAAYARKAYTVHRTPDEVLSARTLDGWSLRVLHYRPRTAAPLFAEPVVLCHGLAANSYNLDLDDRFSVARHLAARGFDVFVPDLRGRDGSWPERSRWRSRHSYTFDDHAVLDGPAILNMALERSGAARAFWVGHSMGGMVGYVLAAREPERIAGLVTLAAPAQLRIDRLLGRLIELALTFPLDPLPQRFFAQAMAPLITDRFPPFADISAIRSNMDRVTLRRALTNVVVDLPRQLIRQFSAWAWKGHPISSHGGVSYLDAVSQIRAPLMSISATGDRLAPPEDVRPGHDLARSGDKQWICLGRGDRDDPVPGRLYGHVDMVLGRDAPDFLFPLITKWLEARASRIGHHRLVAC